MSNEAADATEQTLSFAMSQPRGKGVADVPLTGEIGLPCPLSMVLEAPVFKDWCASVEADPQLYVASVHVQSVDMFGPRIGFMKFRAKALFDVGGDEGVDGIIEVPGIVFMRGGAVGVLVILECEGKEYTLLTHQARVPCGTSDLPEIPAGMLDGSGNFKGVAAEEIQEECHMVISEEELTDLTELAYGARFKGMIPSAGGCDEFIRLYLFRRCVEPSVLETLQGRLTGLREEGERIKLELKPLGDMWQATPDAKALGALALYTELQRAGKLPQKAIDAAATSAAEITAPLEQEVETVPEEGLPPSVSLGRVGKSGSQDTLNSGDSGSGLLISTPSTGSAASGTSSRRKGRSSVLSGNSTAIFKSISTDNQTLREENEELKRQLKEAQEALAKVNGQ